MPIQDSERNNIQFGTDRQKIINIDPQQMINKQQKQLQRIREQVELIENDRSMYIHEKQWLFRQLSGEITFLLDNLLGGNEQQLQDIKQQQDTAIETYGEKNYLMIQKLHEKDNQIELMKLRINEYELRMSELQQVIESNRQKQLQELKTGNKDNDYYQQQQLRKRQLQQQQPLIQHSKQQLLMKKLSQIQKQRDVKIQQLQLMQKHIQHMKLMYSKQNEQLLIERKVQIQRVISQKDNQIAIANDKLEQQKSIRKQLLQLQLAAHQQQLNQLTKRHRNQIGVVRAKYQKDIIKLSSKFQFQIDQFNSTFQLQKKQSLYQCEELENKVKELEEIVQRYDREKKDEDERIRNDNNVGNLNVKDMETKILQLTNQLEQQSKLLQQKCEQIKKYQKQQLNITNQLTQLKQQYMQLKQQRMQLKQQNNQLTTTNTFLQSKNTEMFSQLQKTTRMNQQTNTIASKRLQYLQSQLQQNKKSIQQYKKQISSLNATIQVLKNQISQKDIKLQSLDRQLQRTKNYNQILLSDVKSLSSDVKTLNTKIHELDQSNIDIKKAMLTSRKDLQQYKKKNMQVQSRILTKSALDSLTDRSNNSRIEQSYYQRDIKGAGYKNSQKQQQNLSMHIQRKENSIFVDDNRNNSSLVIDRNEKTMTMGRKDNSLVMQRSNNSLVIQRSNNIMVMQRKIDNSPITSRNRSPLSDYQFRSKYRINVTEQLKKRRAKRQQQLKQQLIKQDNHHHQQQQQQLEHVYSMQTTFSAMPNIKPNLNNIINVNLATKQNRQDRMNLFRKKNQRLVNYRQRIRQEKDSILIKKCEQKKNIYENIENVTIHKEDNAMKVSSQFKSVLTAHEQKKNQLQQTTKPNQQYMLNNQQSKQILIQDTQHEDSSHVRDATRNTHSSLQGQFQYEDLQLTFKPKLPLEQYNDQTSKIIDSARSKSIQDHNRYLSLNSSFEDQNSITQEDIKSNNLRPSTKERIMRQLPVHLLIGK